MSGAYAAYQAVLTYVCLSALALAVAAAILWKLGPVLHKVHSDWLKLDGFGKVVAAVMVCSLGYYGATKSTHVDVTSKTDADSGIGLAYVDLCVTNEVVGTVTSTWTAVSIGWTNGTVTASTPFQARNAIDQEWTVLPKLGEPTFYYDSVTNTMFFGVSGDITRWTMYWVGSDPPGVIVTVDGITLTHFHVDSKKVEIGWECDDPRCKSFMVRRRKVDTVTHDPITEYETLIVTEDKAYVIYGFTVGETWEYQIRGEFYED